MPEITNRGLPQKGDAKTVQLSSGSSVFEAKNERGTTWRKKSSTSRKDPAVASLAVEIESLFKELTKSSGYVSIPTERWHFTNIARFLIDCPEYMQHLVTAYVCDWEVVQTSFGDVSKNTSPVACGLDSIKYRLAIDLIDNPAKYPNANKLFEYKPISGSSSWMSEIRVRANEENQKAFSQVSRTRADINHQAFDFANAIYVTPDTVNELDRYADEETADTAKPTKYYVRENILEKPDPSIKHGFDREQFIMPLSDPGIDLDRKGSILLPTYSIRVNGPGEDPILSRFFGYVPDGKYKKSQHESPEAFERHKRLAAESIAFFLSIPHVYGKFVAIQDENAEAEDFNKLYGITEGIAYGLPQIGLLSQMVTQMGFQSFHDYWDWYLFSYNQLIDHDMCSPKFYSKYHGIKPIYLYDFHKDGFMGLNPCEDILDKVPHDRLSLKKPYEPFYQWINDFPVRHIRKYMWQLSK